MTNHPILSPEERRQVAASERIFAAVHTYLTEMEETEDGGEDIEIRQFEAMKTALAVAGSAKDLRDEAPFGIIDPDYARIYTKARCIAWAEGYALLMHGSFTRDLDLLAVPWAEQACEPEHLVRRIVATADLKLASEAYGEKPHGRLAWTMLFPAFGDPRFVDLSVMPRARDQHASREDGASRLRPEAASPIAAGEAPSPTPARQEEGSRGDTPAGWVLVPREPPEVMWGGLARQIVMWTRCSRPTGHALHRDLKNCGWAIPAWLAEEIPDEDRAPPKGSVAVAIYRAMLSAAPSPDANSGGEAPVKIDGIPVLVRSSSGWLVIAEDGTRFNLVPAAPRSSKTEQGA